MAQFILKKKLDLTARVLSKNPESSRNFSEKTPESFLKINHPNFKTCIYLFASLCLFGNKLNRLSTPDAKQARAQPRQRRRRRTSGKKHFFATEFASSDTRQPMQRLAAGSVYSAMLPHRAFPGQTESTIARPDCETALEAEDILS